MPNVLDDDIIVTEFKLQFRNDIPFRTNTLGEDKKSLIPTTMG